MDAETLTVAFFAREEGRDKVPAALHKAVEAAGGQVAEEGNVKPRELPRWLSRARARAGHRARPAGARGRSSRTSATASSGCCASSRSSRSSTAPGARLGVEEVEESSRQLGRAQDVDARRRARGRRRADRDARAARAAPAGRAPARAALRDGAPAARRARDRRGARRRASRPRRSRRACGCRRSPPTG